MSRSDEPAFPTQFGLVHHNEMNTEVQNEHGLTVFEYLFGCALAGVEGGNNHPADPLHPQMILDRAEMLAEMACDKLEARRVKKNQTERLGDQQDPPRRPTD